MLPRTIAAKPTSFVAVAATAALLARCASSDLAITEPPLAFVHEWSDPPDERSRTLAAAIDERRLFAEMSAEVEARIELREPLPVHHTGCDGDANAYWHGSEEGIELCYEYLSEIADTLESEAELSEAERLDRLAATWLFIFFHELGHALIDVYDLPVVGKEEDAVDDFSTLLLLEIKRGAFVALAADYWWMTSWDFARADFADQHSLHGQRFYSILCTVYGSDPEQFSDIASEDGALPVDYAKSCPKQYEMKRRSWERLLAPWLK